MTGLFLTFEGIDGCGKTTHATALADMLAAWGHEVQLTREPGGTAAGKCLRELVLGGEVTISETAELLMFAADRAQHIEEVIRPATARGAIVISDRFADSTRAYQGSGQGIDTDRLETAIDLATGGLEPDLTVLIDVDVKTARARLDNELDRLEGLPVSFHERVRKGFLTLASGSPDRFCVIDGSGTVEITTASVAEAVVSRYPGLKLLR